MGGDDLSGRFYGRLQVLGRAHGAGWRCVCSCGTETVVGSSNLRAGKTRSCGCLHRELMRDRHTTHGATAGGQSPEYRIWAGMKTRCTNPRCKDFADYGARGVTVCAGWSGSFDAFLADMGPKPSRRHSIERSDNACGYWCGRCDECVAAERKPNCRWATDEIQANNRRGNRTVRLNGVTMTVAQACRITGIRPPTAYTRLDAGWDPELAVTTAPGRRGSPQLQPRQ